MNVKKVYALAKRVEKTRLEINKLDSKLIELRAVKVRLEQQLSAEIGGEEEERTDEET